MSEPSAEDIQRWTRYGRIVAGLAWCEVENAMPVRVNLWSEAELDALDALADCMIERRRLEKRLESQQLYYEELYRLARMELR